MTWLLLSAALSATAGEPVGAGGVARTAPPDRPQDLWGLGFRFGWSPPGFLPVFQLFAAWDISAHLVLFEYLHLEAIVGGIPTSAAPTRGANNWTAVARLGPRVSFGLGEDHALVVAPLVGVRYLQGSFAHGAESGLGVSTSFGVSWQWWRFRDVAIALTPTVGWNHWLADTRWSTDIPALAVEAKLGFGVVFGVPRAQPSAR